MLNTYCRNSNTAELKQKNILLWQTYIWIPTFEIFWFFTFVWQIQVKNSSPIFKKKKKDIQVVQIRGHKVLPKKSVA